MKKTYIFLSLFFCCFIFSQTTIIGGVSGLAYQKSNVKKIILPTDTINGRLMNFHLIRDSITGSLFKKLNVSLDQPTLFIVSNKFGGAEKKIFGKIGSSIIASSGVYDFSDSLKIGGTSASSKIMTFTKSDLDRKINPIVLLNKKTDPTLLISEILVFDKILTSIDQQKIETYLSIKYGITINDISEKMYISSAGDVIWDSKKNKNYNFRITGIGRDEDFGLYQKQSKNAADEHIAVSLSNIQSTNNGNASTIENNKFLLWGDNNQALQFKEVDLLSAHPKRDMMRMWKAQIKNSGTTPINTHLYLTHSGLQQSDKLRLRLFKNEGDYQNDISTDVLGEKINDSVYVFKNTIWDTDQDEIDYFTFNLQDSQSDFDIQLSSNCSEIGNGIIKITVPTLLLPFQYSLKSITTNQMLASNSSANASPVIFNNLQPDNYQFLIHRPGNSDIVRNFDLQGIINQNIDEHYLWQGYPIELDLNTDSYQYTLTSPSGQITTVPPYFLNGLGDYQLKIKNKLGCEIIKTLSVLNQADYDALQSNSQFKKITVYPNPSHDGNFSIKVELKFAKPLTVMVYNSLGTLIKQGQYNSATDFLIPMNIPPNIGYYNIKLFIPGEAKGVNLIIN